MELQIIITLQEYHNKSAESKNRYNNLIYNNFKEIFFYKQRNTTDFKF